MADTEEGRATVQKLQTQLKEQEDDLEETEYEQYIEDQKNLLNDWYEDLQEWIDERLDNLDLLLSEAIEATNLNGSEIASTIQTTADSVGYTVTDDFANIWDNFSIANDENFNILTMTSETTTDMRLKMDELATEAGLEEYFTGEDLALLESITSVDGNLTNTNAAIELSNEAINSVESKVVEAGNSIIDAINAKDLEVTTNVDVNVDGQNASSTSDTSTSGGSGSGNTYISDSTTTSNSGFKVTNGYGTTVATAPTASQAAQEANVIKRNISKAEGNGMPTSVSEQLKKLSVSAYAKGGLVSDEDNILDIIAQSLGEDHMVAAKEGERILTEEQNESFEKMVNANFTPLDSSELEKYSLLSSSVEGLNQTPSIYDGFSEINTPDVANNMSNIGNTTVGDINISLPNVTDKQQFVSWLKNDNQISKVIQSMTIGQMMGKNSYDKLKY